MCVAKIYKIVMLKLCTVCCSVLYICDHIYWVERESGVWVVGGVVKIINRYICYAMQGSDWIGSDGDRDIYKKYNFISICA